MIYYSPVTFYLMMIYYDSCLNYIGDYKMIFNIYHSFYVYWLAYFCKENLPPLFLLLSPFLSFVECHYKLMDFLKNSKCYNLLMSLFFLRLTFPPDGYGGL